MSSYRECGREIAAGNVLCPDCASDGAPKQTGAGEAGFILVGKQGKTLTVAGDTVKFEKKSGLAATRERTVLIRNITSVEVKEPGGFAGFIQFSGANSRDGLSTVSGGAFSAAKDENSVVFSGLPEYQVALLIKSYIESWTASPEVTADSAVPTVPLVSVADEIREFKALMDEGILTPAEFEQKKRQMLGLDG